MTIIETYSDDGYSGTTFDRPDFQEMIEDITRKNCIIVKDLSRLGRNYLNVGNFTENILEKYKIRFISVNEVY
jgi:DNA invertase Pin-like site-specific DNA recombinase